jgi:trimeric autotransporter adhesin
LDGFLNTFGHSRTRPFRNTANGSFALYQALYSNTSGGNNTASGLEALYSNSTGEGNTANGRTALRSNTTGGFNTASGRSALFNNTSGESNIALGYLSGVNLTTGDNNIDIGNLGFPGESGTIRIGSTGTQTRTFIAGISEATASGGVTVFVNASGQLGT